MSTIQLYYNASERNVIGKALTAVNSPISCIIKGDSSIMSPVFIFHTDSGYLTGINYLYWQDTDRYYFIDDMEVLTGSRIALVCSVDVLESFKDTIKNQNVIISKQESSARSNIYYNDGSFVTDTRNFYTVKSFSNGFNDNGEFILVTAGA